MFQILNILNKFTFQCQWHWNIIYQTCLILYQSIYIVHLYLILPKV